MQSRLFRQGKLVEKTYLVMKNVLETDGVEEHQRLITTLNKLCGLYVVTKL